MATVAPRTPLSATSGVTPLASASAVQVFPAQQVAATGGSTPAPTISQTSAEPRSLRIYVTDIILSNSAGTAGIVSILDGSSVIFATNIIATSGTFVANLTTPLRGSPNTALNIQSSSASANINWVVSGYAAQ